jgi:hypothetical protein
VRQVAIPIHVHIMKYITETEIIIPSCCEVKVLRQSYNDLLLNIICHSYKEKKELRWYQV